MQIHHRPGTWDHAIFNTVVQGEYGPVDFRGKTVVDIGAHIGAFSIMAAVAGARRVLAFETGSDNFRLLEANCQPFSQVLCRRLAVWGPRSASGSTLRWRPQQQHENTGGGTVLPCLQVAGLDLSDEAVEEVNCIAFDQIVDELGTVDLLKIDAEGSEYPILLTSTRLDSVVEIVGEYHVLGAPFETDAARIPVQWNVDHLMQHLQAQGYAVARQYREHNGIFRARR